MAMQLINSHQASCRSTSTSSTPSSATSCGRAIGMVRCREFTMMDAYSFDIDEAGLDVSYKAMARAYHRDLPALRPRLRGGASGLRRHRRLLFRGVHGRAATSARTPF